MSYDFLCFDFIKRLYRVKFGYYPNYTNVGYTEENLQELVTFWCVSLATVEECLVRKEKKRGNFREPVEMILKW